MPEREFELYLSVLSRMLRLNEQQRDAISDELRDHMEERFEELVRSGMNRDDAIRQALDEFGDADWPSTLLTFLENGSGELSCDQPPPSRQSLLCVPSS
jgi:hypothetical protein